MAMRGRLPKAIKDTLVFLWKRRIFSELLVPPALERQCRLKSVQQMNNCRKLQGHIFLEGRDITGNGENPIPLAVFEERI